MKIDLENMALAEQVLRRQGDHATAIGNHLTQYASLAASELGLILQLLAPINDAIVDGGLKTTDFSSKLFVAGADKMAASRELYEQAERRAYEAAAAVQAQLGGSQPTPYTPAGNPSLGAAEQSAPSRYGEPDGNVFNQAFWDGYSMAEWADETGSRVGDRIGEGMNRGPVSEAVDVQSFLPRPQAEDPGIEDIRWKAGIIFGAVDWVFEKLVGYSLLEEVTKPFAGDWVRMREASFAWTHTGDAMRGISQNTMAMVPPMAGWTGSGSEAFLGAVALVSQGHNAVAGPTGTIASALKALVMLSKEIAGFILRKLKSLEKKLVRIAAEAAVPVVGWAAAVLEAGFTAYELINDAMTIYKWINRIYDFVSGMTSSIADSVDNAFRMADLYEGMLRGAAARV